MNATEPRFLISAGPTREMIDPVRYISNRSSGKMGYAVAAAARAVSRSVMLVSGPTWLEAPSGVDVVRVVTAQEMADAMFERFDAADVVIMAAAVCDFRPVTRASDKIKKQAFGGVLELEPTVDILAELGRRKVRQVLVGFAVETRDLEVYAADKLARKNLDWIVANTVAAFDTDENTVTLLGRDGRLERWETMSKAEVAGRLVARALEVRT
jgi:phosphopantothenoylcysteine decarboxylase/phosphopantothenate--cysteine ligase